MPDDRISLRQLLALLFAALLAPAIGVSALPDRRPGRRGEVAVRPGRPAGTAGAVLGALCPPAPGRGAGLAQVTETVLGRGWARGYFFSIYCGVCFCSAPTPGFSPSVSCPPVTGTPPWVCFC
ncbi:MAG: hypothetical protein ACLRNQ_18605 [Flavonifractor plautii]